MTKRFSLYAGLVAVLFTTASMSGCKKPKEETTPFDKASLLVNLADHLIIPAVNDFSTKIGQLESDYIQFQSDRTAVNLETVRNSWKEAYLSWQVLKPYDFGPIRDLGFKGASGVFPTDTAKIDANITSGSYNLASAANVDAIGLHALDYFLFRVNALSHFIGNDPYTTYGLEVIQKVKNEANTVATQWTSYRATFVASTGTESTSAFSKLVNEFNRDYELAKNAKVGIPLGKQSLNIQLPEYIEAKRSGFSLEILHKSIETIKNLYNGVSFDGTTNGQGFDNYLSHLERSTLNSSINTNFDAILTKIDSFNGTFEQEMQSNTAGTDELYSLLQGQVVSLKTDMTSAFGVLITYQDNDGD